MTVLVTTNPTAGPIYPFGPGFAQYLCDYADPSRPDNYEFEFAVDAIPSGKVAEWTDVTVPGTATVTGTLPVFGDPLTGSESWTISNPKADSATADIYASFSYDIWDPGYPSRYDDPGYASETCQATWVWDGAYHEDSTLYPGGSGSVGPAFDPSGATPAGIAGSYKGGDAGTLGEAALPESIGFFLRFYNYVTSTAVATGSILIARNNPYTSIGPPDSLTFTPPPTGPWTIDGPVTDLTSGDSTWFALEGLTFTPPDLGEPYWSYVDVVVTRTNGYDPIDHPDACSVAPIRIYLVYREAVIVTDEPPGRCERFNAAVTCVRETEDVELSVDTSHLPDDPSEYSITWGYNSTDQPSPDDGTLADGPWHIGQMDSGQQIAYQIERIDGTHIDGYAIFTAKDLFTGIYWKLVMKCKNTGFVVGRIRMN